MKKYSFFYLIFLCYFFLFINSNEINNFQNWFLDNNGKINSITISSFDKMGRGILTKNNITKNKQILFIPSNIIISSKLIKNSNDILHQKISQSFHKEEELIISFLLLEKSRNKKSFWSPYLEVLPKYVPNLSQFDKDELKLLQSSLFSSEIIDSWKLSVKNYNNFLEKVKSYWPSNLKTISLQEYMWASSIIDSRGFRFRGEIKLVPYSDMFNYLPHPDPRPPNGGNFFLEHHLLTDEGLEVLADRDCQAGQQLFEDYGDNSDKIYLQYHGFVPENNPFRCIPLSTISPFHPSISEKKKQLLNSLQLKKPITRCVDQTGELGQALIAFETILALNDEEVDRCANSLSHTPKHQWSFIMVACGILHTSNFISTELKLNSIDDEPTLDLFPNSLNERFYKELTIFFERNIEELKQTTLQEDKVILTQLSKDLELNDQNFTKVLKKYNAISYRFYVKQHLVSLCKKFQINCGIQPLIIEENKLSSSTSTSSLSTTTFNNKINTLYDIWNMTKQQKDLYLNSYLNEFNTWFNSNIKPPSVNYLQAKYIPGYRIGTITTKSLKLDEIYLSIPNTVIIDLLSAFHDRPINTLIHQLQRSYKRKDEFHELLFHLIYESFSYGVKSKFWNYLRLLPTPSEMDIPLFWTKEQIESRLKPSFLKHEILNYNNRVERYYELVSSIPQLEEFKYFNILNYETYKWATAILDSRSIWWNGQRHLVPMLDFINCKERNGPNNEIMRIHATKVERFEPIDKDDLNLVDDISLAVTRSAWSYQSGEQLFENYGQPNHIYFTYHGFILPLNSNDCVHFSIQLTSEEMKKVDTLQARHIFEFLRMSPTNNIPPTSFCLAPKMSFDEIPSRIWVYLSLKMNQYGSSQRDLAVRPTSQSRVFFTDLVYQHYQGYLSYDNKEYPHELTENFIASEKEILETWLKTVGEKNLLVQQNLGNDKSEL